MTTQDMSASSISPGASATTTASPSTWSDASQQLDQPAVVPVRFEERISALDTIRGFAVLGILLMNICSFGLPESAYSNPTPAGGVSGRNLFTWAIMEVLADGKMRAIFSLAFGASVYLLVERLTRKGAAADAADIHYRRMLWLLLFGLIHAYFIWGGDILFPYAMMGLLLYPLRKLSPRILLVAAGILFLIMSGFVVGDYFHQRQQQREYVQIQADEKAGKKLTADQEDAKKEWEQVLKDFSPSADDLKKETDAHRGSYFQLVAFRAKDVYRFHSFPIYFPFPWFDILAMMLIGIAFLKLGILTGSYSTKFYVWMAMLSFAIGLPAHAWAIWWFAKGQFSIDSANLANVAYEIGRVTAFGYIAVILLLIKSGLLRLVTKTLAAVGQMAFSNYIFTSLVCTAIFEGYGFGLFGKLQRYQLYAVVALVWAAILIISPIWLRHFRFGPLEWVWRSLTYWKKQPFRIRDSAVA
jgi:uncharacterized protein